MFVNSNNLRVSVRVTTNMCTVVSTYSESREYGPSALKIDIGQAGSSSTECVQQYTTVGVVSQGAPLPLQYAHSS